MMGLKRAQKGRKKTSSLRLDHLGTKIPQGVILPAAWICTIANWLSYPFQIGRMRNIQI
jgi:hypothetical protein